LEYDQVFIPRFGERVRAPMRTLSFGMQLQVFQIDESICRLRCAHFLGKMVETALFKQKRAQFHNYSTFCCGFVE